MCQSQGQQLLKCAAAIRWGDGNELEPHQLVGQLEEGRVMT